VAVPELQGGEAVKWMHKTTGITLLPGEDAPQPDRPDVFDGAPSDWRLVGATSHSFSDSNGSWVAYQWYWEKEE